MKNAIKKVEKWQKLFGRMEHIVSDTPTTIETITAVARTNFIQEELQEYLTANSDDDVVGVLDALIDLQYFLFGTVAIHGLQEIFPQAFDIVHECNMSKLFPGDKVVTNSQGKVLKPSTFKPPEEALKKLVEEMYGDTKP